MKNAAVTVLDAGARYGMHPTWSAYKGDLAYVMFEPDPGEAGRLAKKYEDRGDIRVESCALGNREGEISIKMTRHKGVSSVFAPNEDSFWFGLTHRGEGDIVSSYTAPMTTVDLFARRNSLAFDFMKIDTEGSEAAILEGAMEQLASSVCGLRTEVQCDQSFHGAPTIAEIFKILNAQNFFLVNLDYDGRGAHLNQFCAGSRYGVLAGTDAVWLKRFDCILDKDRSDTEIGLRAVKSALFCFHNHATDVGMELLLRAKDMLGEAFFSVSDTAVYRSLDVAVQRLFYTLSRSPGGGGGKLQEVYFSLFRRQLKELHNFFESEEING